MQFTYTEFKAALKSEFEKLMRSIASRDSEILTRKRAAQFLECDLSTLSEWTSKGLVQAHRIGNRVYYKREELIGCMVPVVRKSKPTKHQQS